MTMIQYQAAAQRTSTGSDKDKLVNGCMGLCGEAGECIDILKKHMHQGHELDKAHLTEELGDVLWYCAELATGLGVTLDQVAQRNLDKLQRRYPEGFDPARSVNREASHD